jgi:hypothetical protein
VGNGARPEISERIRSKGAGEKESLLLNVNLDCLPNWQDIQSNYEN